MRFYLDTSIWLDLHEERTCYAKELLSSLIVEQHMVVYSDLVVEELLQLDYFMVDIQNLFLRFKPFIEKVHVTRKWLLEARGLSKRRNVPFKDAIHAVLARESESVLLTRDHHFFYLRDIADIRHPEDVI